MINTAISCHRCIHHPAVWCSSCFITFWSFNFVTSIGFWRLKYHTIMLHHNTCNISIKWPSSYFYHIWPSYKWKYEKMHNIRTGFMSPLLVGNGFIVRWDDDLGRHIIWKQWTQMIEVTNNRWHRICSYTTMSLYIPQCNQLTQWARHNY